MAHISGLSGNVSTMVGTVTTTVAGIKAWSADYTIEVLESTDFADAGVKAYILGGKGWSGSFDGFKDGVPLALATGTVALSLNESVTSTWTGNAFITGVHPNVSFDGIVTYSYDFQGTGAFTVTTGTV